MIESGEAFEDGVAILAALEEAGALRLLVLPPALVQVELLEDRPSFERVLSDRSSTVEDLDDVAEDVADALGALIAGASEQRFVEVRQREYSEDEELSARKYQVVKGTFDIGRLERRLWAKSSAKTLVPSIMRWEVSMKYDDSDEDPPGDAPVPVGVVSLTARPADLPFAVSQIREELMTMTVDLQDIDYFVDTLGRLRQALVRMERERPTS